MEIVEWQIGRSHLHRELCDVLGVVFVDGDVSAVEVLEPVLREVGWGSRVGGEDVGGVGVGGSRHS